MSRAFLILSTESAILSKICVLPWKKISAFRDDGIWLLLYC